MSMDFSGFFAGPSVTEPSATLKRLPWHGQLIGPCATSPTTQPAWVQTAVKQRKVPAVGWVMTIFRSAKILPPPTGMSLVLAKVVSAPLGALPFGSAPSVFAPSALVPLSPAALLSGAALSRP